MGTVLKMITGLDGFGYGVVLWFFELMISLHVLCNGVPSCRVL